MKKLRSLLLLFVPVSLCAQALSPEDAFEKHAKYSRERVFIQFDKGEYLAGESMHFKAYVFSKLKLSPISTNLYFECLGQDKKIIYKTIYPLASGMADGSFTIPKNLPENIYYFRAYTSWMLNFNEQYQFIQPLAIYNPSSKTKLVKQPIAWTASAHVEGGTLLDNVITKVVVRLHNLGRLPHQWSGYVFEGADSSQQLETFTSINDEVASLQLIPVAGKQYSIKISDGLGHHQVVPLPPVAKQGVAFKVVNLSQGIGYRLEAKGLSLEGFKILAHLQDTLLYSAIVKNGTQIEGIIPVDPCTRGLVHMTLFDPKGEIAAERLCFANLQRTMDRLPQVDLTRTTARNKALNELDFCIDTIYPDTYTAAVVDAAVPTSNEIHSLFHTFWLAALPVTPYVTNGYFDPKNPGTSNALDALLISEQWALFDWKTIRSKPAPGIKYFPDNYISYLGHVSRNNQPLSKQNVNIVFLLNDSSRVLMEVRTDSLGNFRLKNLIYRDTAKVFYHQANVKSFKDKIDVTLTRVEHYTPYQGALPVAPFAVTERLKGDTVPQQVRLYLATLKQAEAEDERYKILESVTVRAKTKSLKEKLNKELSSPLFRDPGETVFDFVNEIQDIPAEGALAWLDGRVAGAIYENQQLYIRNQPARVYIDEYLDEDGSRLIGLPPTEIAMIKVIKNAFMTPGAGGGPVVAVYLKRAQSGAKPALPLPTMNIPSKTITGYPVVQKWEAPDYAEPKIDTTQKDSRSVLYWNTWFDPEKDKASIRFYNNDTSKKLRLLIVGFTNDGLPVYLNKEITL